jgi:hypothetical protein
VNRAFGTHRIVGHQVRNHPPQRNCYCCTCHWPVPLILDSRALRRPRRPAPG